LPAAEHRRPDPDRDLRQVVRTELCISEHGRGPARPRSDSGGGPPDRAAHNFNASRSRNNPHVLQQAQAALGLGGRGGYVYIFGIYQISLMMVSYIYIYIYIRRARSTRARTLKLRPYIRDLVLVQARTRILIISTYSSAKFSTSLFDLIILQ
jgi:hypothetical protein